MNLDIHCEEFEVNRAIRQIKDLGSSLNTHSIVRFRKDTIPSRARTPMRYAIIDLECYYPKVLGVLITDHIFQFYITVEEDYYELYEILFRIFRILKKFYLFTFSQWEFRFLNALKHDLLKTHSKEEVEFFNTLNVINIQHGYYESLNAVFYSMNKAIPPDPILRISEMVDTLFEIGQIELILKHNRFCLIMTLEALENRYFRLNLF